MTAIVYRDGILAADSGVWQGSVICGHREKVCFLNDGSLFAGCGESADVIAAKEWLNGGDKPPTTNSKHEFSAILVRPDGSVHRVNDRHIIVPYTKGEWAVDGAPMEFLHGALAAGASAIDAVRLAIKYTDGAAGEVSWVKVGNI